MSQMLLDGNAEPQPVEADRPKYEAPPLLDPLRFPLRGSRLIEASAGTGKTYTIATLYVRLVLGHRDGETANRAYTPPEILVVTFTDAATQELRDRIRARLSEAAEYFRADPAQLDAPVPGTDVLHDLRADYPPEQWTGCARKLQLAAEWMDEAAVSTIHGWCHRMLREHAFDSDSLFNQTLETDPSELLAEVVRDYWRSFMAPLDAELAAEVAQWWAEPDVLRSALDGLLSHVDRLETAAEPAVSIKQAADEKRRQLEALKAPWHSGEVRNSDAAEGNRDAGNGAWVEQLERLLGEAVDKKLVDGRKLRRSYFEPWLQALRDWGEDSAAVWPSLTPSAWTRLTPVGMADAAKPGQPPLRHPAFEAIARLKDALKALPSPREDVLRHAAHWVAERFAAEQASRAQLGYNELLTGLDAALRGPNGQRLAALIRAQFPVALIDEFQDTDPVQYRIFDAVYAIASNDTETAVVLIGDPKQAIYAFRGADIYTYLAARRACAGRLSTLKTNYRSTKAMVDAVNRVFGIAEQRQVGAGAFGFRTERENPLPFIEADAYGCRETLQAEHQRLPALSLWWLPPKDGDSTLTKEGYREQIAESCASEIVRLLNLGHVGQAGFVASGARPDSPIARPLRPADVAILVNTGGEAQLIRRALARRGLRSVYLSDRQSVYSSAQAGEIRLWLAACAEPDDSRLLRAALATRTLGLSFGELDRLNRDERAWEARVMQFRDYRERWRRQGVLPMLRRLLSDFDVPARLLGASPSVDDVPPSVEVDGERILTDLLHLAELLQQASRLLEGEQALIRYLAEQCQDAPSSDVGGDARQLRLESDAGLVQVITVHKSKGLQYPLVFLPFAADHRATKPEDLPLKWHDDRHELRLALSADDDVLEQVERERLGEDLRKLYVALTRAQYAAWVGLAPLAGVERGAFGYLLGGGAPLTDRLEAVITAELGGCDPIAITQAPEPTNTHFRGAAHADALGSARESRRVDDARWWIASYSALRKTAAGVATRAERLADALASGTPVPETSTEDQFQELRADGAAATEAERAVAPSPRLAKAAAALPVPYSGHAFFRGPEAGTFLHDLLEWTARRGFAEVALAPELLRDQVARRCQMRGWDAWIDPLTRWLQQLIEEPLRLPALGGAPATAFSLAGLSEAVPEMEFWLAVHRVDTGQIDRLVRAHTLDGAARPGLEPNRLNGMLKGFIDLVFVHEGRYYVADYKSNWLGPDAAAYTPDAMRSEILHARYELQYVLYLLALHRLLKARLPSYDYDRHVGGAVYLFLRGSDAPSQGLHAERPPRALIEAMDDCFSTKAEEVAR